MSKKNKSDFLCEIPIYIFADRGCIPTLGSTQKHFAYEVDPALQFDFNDRTAFAESLEEAIKHGNPPIEAPPRLDTPGVMQKLLESKTWEDVERSSILFSLWCWRDAYQLRVFGRKNDGTWQTNEDPILDKEIPVELGVGQIVDAVLKHLNSRFDLVGTGKS